MAGQSEASRLLIAQALASFGDEVKEEKGLAKTDDAGGESQLAETKYVVLPGRLLSSC